MKIKPLIVLLVMVLVSILAFTAVAQGPGNFQIFLPMVGKNSGINADAGPSGPLLSVTPGFGPATTLAEVKGAGFDESPCGVNLYWDSVDMEPLASTYFQKGIFSSLVVIPVDAEIGEHKIIAQGLLYSGEFCGDTSGQEASISFFVTEDVVNLPFIVIEEGDATPGATIHVSGAGFCSDPACSPITILIAGLPGAQDVPVAEDGTFNTEAVVPGGTPILDTVVVALQTDAQGKQLRAFGELSIYTRPNRPRPPVITDSGNTTGVAGALPWFTNISDGLPPDAASLATIALGGLLLLAYLASRRERRGLVLSVGLAFSLLAVFLIANPLVTWALAPSVVTDVNPDGLPAEPRYGGRSLGITISPATNQNAFVASELGGIFASTNGGGNWSHVDAIPLTIARDVMYDPQNANILIASGRYDGGTTNNGGIWRSTNGGATWAKPATSNPGCSAEASTWGIAIPNDAANHNRIFVGTDCGLAVSADSGATWTHVDPCPAGTSFCAAGGAIFDVEARVVGGAVQVDLCGSEGFFRSSDGGNTWTAPDANSPSRTGLNPCHIATAPGNANTVYLANWSGVNASGFCDSQLLESTTGGSAGSWMSMGVVASNCRDAWVVTHPALDGDPNHFEVYFGDSQRVRHQNCDLTTTPRCDTGTANWPTADTGAHPDPSDIAFNTATPNGCPQILSTDGGISTSSDCGATWVDGNRGLHALDIAALAGTVENNHTDLYFGTQDNGMYFSQDGAATWSRPLGADVYNVFADHNTPARVWYRQCFGCGDSIAAAHMVGAAAFNDPPGTVSTTAVATQFGNNRYAIVTNDGGNPALWTVYVTTDGGANWSQMGPNTLPGRPGEIKSAGPVGSPTFYLRLNVGGQLRIYRLTGALNNTATLALANTGLNAPSGAWDVDPSDPNRLYVSDVGTGQIMFSTNGGASWAPDAALSALVTRLGAYQFTSNTLGSQVSTIAFDENSNTIMVGTRTAGMFVSVTNGASWLNVPGAELLPLARDFFFDERTGAIYAATRGRGIWRIDLPEADLSLEKSDNPDPAVAGDPLAYTLKVTNNGPDTAYDAVLVDTLPPEVDFVSAVPGCVQGPVRTITCTLGNLANGASISIGITVKVHANVVYNAGGPLTIQNSASVFSATPDSTPGNDKDTEDTLVVAVADLAIVSFEAVDPPAEILVGEPVAITLRKVVTNHGPSAPMDTLLTKTAIPPVDGTATPMSSITQALGLGLEEQREVLEVFTIQCNGASQHTFSFTNKLEPLHPEDTDPDLNNNEASVDVTLECVVPVAINIKPKSFPNSVNPFDEGVIPLAVLTTKAGEYGLPLDFDATTIDPLSVRFGPYDLVWSGTGGAEAHDRGHIEYSYELDEKTRDQDLDMVLHFWTLETGIVPTTSEACIKGAWIDSGGNTHHFFGCDSVRIVPSAFK